MSKKNKNKDKNRLLVPNDLQTHEAKITAVHRVMSEHPSNTINPSALKSLFDDAESGNIVAQHELFLDIEERDSAISSAISTRKNSILTLDYRIEPPKNANAHEQKLTDEANELINGIDGFEDLLIDLMDAVGHGFSAIEIQWELINGLQVPVAFKHRPQTWFRWDKDDNLLLKTPDNSMGEPLWPLAWIIHKHNTRSTQAARNGLFRTLAWLYMFKHYAASDFAEFLELYGMPIRIGKYNTGASEKEKSTLLRAVAEIGHNAAGIMPEGMQIEIVQAANGTTSGNNPFMTMIDWCEKSAAKVILGQTLTSGSDGKSSTNALGIVHNEVRRDLMISDAKKLAQTITQQIILPYLNINFGWVEKKRNPYFEFDTREVADFSTLADSLSKLVDVGVQIPEDWVREKLAIPDIKGDEPILVRSNPFASASLSSQPSCSCCSSQKMAALSGHINHNSPQSLLDKSIDEAMLSPDFNAQLDPIVKQAVACVMECDSYEEASTALTALFPNLEHHQLQGYMQKALYLSDLLGQANG